MINNLESKSKKELTEIIDCQLVEYAKLVKSKHELEKQNEFEMEQKYIARERRNEIAHKLKELEKQNAELRKERDEFKSLALLITTDVIDLVRCGIGGNYGGVRYEEKMSETHAPILKAFNGVKPSLQAHNLKHTRKGFWLGFEDARCHPDEMNILKQWEGTLVFNRVKALKDGE